MFLYLNLRERKGCVLTVRYNKQNVFYTMSNSTITYKTVSAKPVV